MDVRRICQLLITVFVFVYFLIFYAACVVVLYFLWISSFTVVSFG